MVSSRTIFVDHAFFVVFELCMFHLSRQCGGVAMAAAPAPGALNGVIGLFGVFVVVSVWCGWLDVQEMDDGSCFS